MGLEKLFYVMDNYLVDGGDVCLLFGLLVVMCVLCGWIGVDMWIVVGVNDLFVVLVLVGVVVYLCCVNMCVWWIVGICMGVFVLVEVGLFV